MFCCREKIKKRNVKMLTSSILMPCEVALLGSTSVINLRVKATAQYVGVPYFLD